jgi:Ca2+-binding EF-hand superfamily protein
MKSLIAAGVAAALAMPFAAIAADKSPTSAAKSSGASGAESMFKSLDKNNDGFISREEAKGSPHEKDFAALDKNNDGKLSREEHAAALEHSGDKRPDAAASSTPAPK